MAADRDNLPETTPQDGSGNPKIAEQVTPPGAAPSAAPGKPSRPVIVMRYPKPPAFPIRLVRMCLRPEEWAEAARYPLWTTLLLAALALFLSSAFFSAGNIYRIYTTVAAFAADYDHHYPPLELSGDGILSVRGELKEPIRFTINDASIVIDPSGKTTAGNLPESPTLLITNRDYIFQGGPLDQVTPLKELIQRMRETPGNDALTQPTDTEVIDTASLSGFLRHRGLILAVIVGILVVAVKMVTNGLWMAAMGFLAGPIMVAVGAAAGGANRRGLVIPRRIAYRIAIAVTIPLVMFEGIAGGLGYSVGNILGMSQFSLLFWILACSALAFWAGRLARTIFGPPVERPQAG